MATLPSVKTGASGDTVLVDTVSMSVAVGRAADRRALDEDGEGEISNMSSAMEQTPYYLRSENKSKKIVHLGEAQSPACNPSSRQDNPRGQEQR